MGPTSNSIKQLWRKPFIFQGNTAIVCIFRNMCLNQWAFCNISVTPGMQTWKKYYLHRSNIEHKMISGRPSVDYTCKAMRGHEGMRCGKNPVLPSPSRDFFLTSIYHIVMHYILCLEKHAGAKTATKMCT